MPRRCCDVCSALPTGTPVFVGLEAEPGVPVKQVTEEIVDCVGQWEKIVDAPVPLRCLDAELGDRFLQVLEQIVEVLKVLPEQIASHLKGWVYEERISERSGVQTVDLPVPQVMESVELQLECVAEQIVDLPVPQVQGDVLQHVPERVQNCVGEQIGAVPVPQIGGLPPILLFAPYLIVVGGLVLLHRLSSVPPLACFLVACC